MESVDYVNHFIAVAPDSSASTGLTPPHKEQPTVAARQFAMVAEHPYEYTSGDVIFTVWADRRDIPEADRPAARAEYYSKGQACMRSSDLGKRYGWGLHSDAEGRLAAYAVDSPEYAAFLAGQSPMDGSTVAVAAAMRSRR
jgi:hypothetical protein